MMKADDHQELPLSFVESEIFPRLPAKSVGSCMRVCKQLKSFLSTPTFARMHLHHVTNNDYKLLLDRPRDAFVLASFDGLVCLASWEQPTQLAFWNPLTGAYKKLSSHSSFRFSNGIYNDVVGFYKDSSNDYKLLYLVKGGDFGAYVYSNMLDSWREVEFIVESNDPCIWSVPTWSAATFYGQCLYFIVTSETFQCHSWIVCFDVKTETFRKIQFPHVPRDAGEYCGSLVVVNGRLHLCVCTAGGGDWVAVLDEEKSSFRKLDVEEFRRYRCLCSRSWEYGYVETLVSPNP